MSAPAPSGASSSSIRESVEPNLHRTRPRQTTLAKKPLLTLKPIKATALAKHFTRAKKAELDEILETLVQLGRARQSDNGGFSK